MAEQAEQDLLKFVGFRIEDWRFGVRLEQVRTAILPCRVTRVFHLPEFVKGIISLHGTIVGVLDLGKLLGLSTTQGAYRRFLVVSSHGIQAAIPVHEVFRIPNVPLEAIDALPTTVTPAQKQYLEGVINCANVPGSDPKKGEDTITLLDSDMLFDSPVIRALRGKP